MNNQKSSSWKDNFFIWQSIFTKFAIDYCPRQRYNHRGNCSDRTIIAYIYHIYWPIKINTKIFIKAILSLVRNLNSTCLLIYQSFDVNRWPITFLGLVVHTSIVGIRNVHLKDIRHRRSRSYRFFFFFLIFKLWVGLLTDGRR